MTIHDARDLFGLLFPVALIGYIVALSIPRTRGWVIWALLGFTVETGLALFTR